LATGFGLNITKSTGNDQSHFEEKKVHILSNCVIENINGKVISILLKFIKEIYIILEIVL